MRKYSYYMMIDTGFVHVLAIIIVCFFMCLVYGYSQNAGTGFLSTQARVPGDVFVYIRNAFSCDPHVEADTSVTK